MAKGLVTGMKRLAAGACALMLAAGLGGCSLATPTLAEVERDTVRAKVSGSALVEDGVLTAAVDSSDAPQAMQGSDGELTGYNVDVARALAQRMGLSLRLVDTTSGKGAVEDGEADIFLSTEPDGLKSPLGSAGTVLDDAPAVFAKSADGSSAAVTVDAMAGAVVAVQESSASQDALARAGVTADQKTFSNVNECFEALDRGEVGYVACDAAAGAYLARAYPGTSFAGTIGSTTSYDVAVSSKNTELADAVASALDAMGSDGTLDAVHRVWYGGMPLGLDDSLLSGVDISEAEEAGGDASAESDGASGDAAGEGSSDDPASDNAVEGGSISGDINSLEG